MVTNQEYGAFYASYVDRFKDKNILPSLIDQKIDFTAYLKSLNSTRLQYQYAKNKWTLAEIILHIIDAERVFAYRALSISRKEKQNLIGFDQDDYVKHSNATKRSLDSLCEEFISVRNASISLFANFSEDQLVQIGKVNSFAMSVRALAYIILGHCDHHFEILNSQYA